MKNKAVFIDRDGVINPEIYNPDTGMYEAPKEIRDFAIYPRVLKSLLMLRDEGYNLFIISNQPDYAKGKAKLEDIEAIGRLLWEFSDDNGGLFEDCFYCYHHPEGTVPEYAIKCKCRKPGTLFIEQAVSRYDLDAKRCFMVGDRDTDVLCGYKSGFSTVRIDSPRVRRIPSLCVPDAIAEDIYEAAIMIIDLSKSSEE